MITSTTVPRFILSSALQLACLLLCASAVIAAGISIDRDVGESKELLESNLNGTSEGYTPKQRRYDGAQVWRILLGNSKEKGLTNELLAKYGGQIWKEENAEVDCLLKANVLNEAEQVLQAANISKIVLIDNLQAAIEAENPNKDEIGNFENRNGHRMTWQAYHRTTDFHDFIDFLAKTYPDLCSTETIGYSIQKRPLKILKISNQKANNPAIWIDGGMHAREWVSPAAVAYIINNIVEGWDDLPDYMKTIDWYIHPLANPDGYEYTHSTDRLWRKNLRSHGRQCPGVDLNRNFGYIWGGKGTSANHCSEIYRGSSAFSEPESMAIASFITQKPRNYFKAYLTFHSYGQYILYPWGYEAILPNDASDLERVAREASARISRSNNVRYTVGSSAKTLYPAAGGSDDWARGVAGIKYAYTVELGDTGRHGFILPSNNIEKNGADAFTFIKAVARTVAKIR